MVSNRLSLLLDDDLDEIRDAAARLRVLLPGLKVDKFVELFPIALDVDNFEMAIEVRRGHALPGWVLVHTCTYLFMLVKPCSCLYMLKRACLCLSMLASLRVQESTSTRGWLHILPDSEELRNEASASCRVSFSVYCSSHFLGVDDAWSFALCACLHAPPPIYPCHITRNMRSDPTWNGHWQTRLPEMHAPFMHASPCLSMQDAARMLPGMDVVDMLRRQPDTILSLVKGKNLIPYDAISNPWS